MAENSGGRSCMIERYSRQILFSGIGEEGQKRLESSSVLIIGCGALGTIIATSLVRAGVGKVKIADRDFISFGNRSIESGVLQYHTENRPDSSCPGEDCKGWKTERQIRVRSLEQVRILK